MIGELHLLVINGEKSGYRLYATGSLCKASWILDEVSVFVLQRPCSNGFESDKDDVPGMR